MSVRASLYVVAPKTITGHISETAISTAIVIDSVSTPLHITTLSTDLPEDKPGTLIRGNSQIPKKPGK